MGALRLLLALSVVSSHTDGFLNSDIAIAGVSAVQAFFIISGFYMALVLNENYTATGAFYVARLLRLYPAYLLSLILLILAFLYVPGGIVEILSRFSPVSTLEKVHLAFSNIFILGADLPFVLCVHNTGTGECIQGGLLVLNAPVWSISTEITFYLLAPFVLKSIYRTLLFAGTGIVYGVVLYFVQRKLQLDVPALHAYTYFSFPSSMIFFATGALSYHLVYRTSSTNHLRFSTFYSVVVILFFLTIFHLGKTPLVSLLAIMPGVAALFHLTKHSRLDRFVGDLSYPVYLFHIPIVTWIGAYEVFGASPIHTVLVYLNTSLGRGIVVAAVTLATSLLVVLFLDHPIDRLRHHLAARIQARATNRQDRAATLGQNTVEKQQEQITPTMFDAAAQTRVTPPGIPA